MNFQAKTITIITLRQNRFCINYIGHVGKIGGRIYSNRTQEGNRYSFVFCIHAISSGRMLYAEFVCLFFSLVKYTQCVYTIRHLGGHSLIFTEQIVARSDEYQLPSESKKFILAMDGSKQLWWEARMKRESQIDKEGKGGKLRKKEENSPRLHQFECVESCACVWVFISCHFANASLFNSYWATSASIIHATRRWIVFDWLVTGHFHSNYEIWRYGWLLFDQVTVCINEMFMDFSTFREYLKILIARIHYFAGIRTKRTRTRGIRGKRNCSLDQPRIFPNLNSKSMLYIIG